MTPLSYKQSFEQVNDEVHSGRVSNPEPLPLLPWVLEHFKS